MLGVEDICFLDHSNYEGADSIIDLNVPLPANLESRYDFIIAGAHWIMCLTRPRQS